MDYIGGDQVLLFGGAEYEGNTDDTWIFDLSERTWTELSLAIHPSARNYLDAAHIGDGQVIIFGGRDTTGYLDDTWLYTHEEPQPPVVTVLQPDGGEVLSGSATISWIATDPDPGDSTLLLVDLDYSSNAGGSWSVIDTDQTNDGSHLWDISGLLDGDDYLVRVTATDPNGKSGSDSSDAVFAIDNPDTPTVTVTYPNGGETLSGSAIITWTADDPDSGETSLLTVDLDYSENGGSSWSSIATDEVNDGSHSWDVSGLSDGSNYLVRVTVTDTTGRTDGDNSDAVFSIDSPDSPEVTVTHPNGGGILSDSVTITWIATDPDLGETALLLVDLDYSADDAGSWSVIDSNQANDGEYFWNISGLPDGNNYLVRIAVTDPTGKFDSDSSDSAFTIDNTPTSFDDDGRKLKPESHALLGSYPNPFNARVNIRYQVGALGDGPSLVSMSIYNISGQRVRQLIDAFQPPGTYDVQWDGQDETGSQVASGLYLCRLEVGGFRDARKIVLLK
jgi:hypothetical protein